MFGCLVVWMFGCLIVRLFGCLDVRVYGWLVVRVFGCMDGWLFGCKLYIEHLFSHVLGIKIPFFGDFRVCEVVLTLQSK